MQIVDADGQPRSLERSANLAVVLRCLRGVLQHVESADEVFDDRKVGSGAAAFFCTVQKFGQCDVG